jgi:trimeric autotransporter adhesin
MTVLNGTANDDEIISYVDTVTEIRGLGGNDYIFTKNDRTVLVYGGLGNDLVQGFAAADAIYGEAGDDTLLGGKGVDSLEGGTGNDTLIGGAGVDTLTGGLGNETYVLDLGSPDTDIFVEGFNQGTDTVVLRESDGGAAFGEFTLPQNIENLVALGVSAAFLYGNALANRLTGNDGFNILDGKAGADTMIGGRGFDQYFVDDISDVVVENPGEGTDQVISKIDYALGANVENVSLDPAGAALKATGNALNNIISGNDLYNKLDGGIGADIMFGGLGEDDYYVDNVGDVVNETGFNSIDTVYSTVSFTLGALVEILALQGAASINGTGNGLDNGIYGNEGNNVIRGLSGNDGLSSGFGGIDLLYGGEGDDTYLIMVPGARAIEGASQGTDAVYSWLPSYVLPLNIENLDLYYAIGASNGTGNALSNELRGNDSANILDGKAGQDTMFGLFGADTFFVDNPGDVVVEDGPDIDTVKSTISYVLQDKLENLVLLGTAGIGGAGNALVNAITGNAAANALDGGAGADTLTGGLGNDLYFVDDANDKTIEAANAGTDTVYAGLSWTLAVNVEKLVLTGMGDLSGTGNALANHIDGNGDNNTLNGLGGADRMAGGMGADIYIVDNTGDVVVEIAAGGVDEIRSSASFTLSLNVETLILTGAAIAGTGNVQANTIKGNAAANLLDGAGGVDVLDGGGGADTLQGGLGLDVLTGGAAADRFAFADDNLGADQITDFLVGTDDIVIDASAFGGGLAAAGALAANRLVIGPSGGAPVADKPFGQFLYDRDDGRLFWDPNGNTVAGGAVFIATLTGAPLISGTDFVIVA